MFIQEGLSGSCSNSNVSSDHSFTCLNSEHTPKNQRRTLNTKNAYFYWVTREQGSFDWFREIMNEIADSDIKVRIHIFTLHLNPLFVFTFEFAVL